MPADRPPFEPVATAMALTEPPAVGETDAVFVRPVESFEDRVLSDEITTAGFGVDERERAAFAEIAPARFAAYREHDDYLRFLAFVDETPVASAAANACELGLLVGGVATLRAARGQGAYRALVQARWDEAVKRGTPGLGDPRRRHVPADPGTRRLRARLRSGRPLRPADHRLTGYASPAISSSSRRPSHQFTSAPNTITFAIT